jgi:hypothetical protein
MIGDFKMESSTGFNNYMWELSVDWFTRQIAVSLYPLQKLRQTVDGEISLDTETTFKTTETKFRLGEAFTENTADGRVTQTTATLDENKLIKVQVPDASTGYHSTREVREFLDEDNDGVYETMKLILTIPGKPAATSTRIYKRVEQS